MRDKIFYFLSGLPRSGSTVLASILSQNPLIHVSPISILIGLVDSIRNVWDYSEHTKVHIVPGQYENMMKGLFHGLYHHIDNPIIIDKNRAWPHPLNILTLYQILGVAPKIICTVRDLPDILASFLRLIHNSQDSLSKLSFIDKDLVSIDKECTDENRCNHLMSHQGHVFQAWSVLKWGYESQYRNCFHIVEYEDLVHDPGYVLLRIHDFLDVDQYRYNFEDIENSSQEDDSLYGLPGMHSVRKSLHKKIYDTSTKEVLGPLYERYKGGSFWR